MSAHVAELLWHLSCLFGRVGVLSSSSRSLLAAVQARGAGWLQTEAGNRTVARLGPQGASEVLFITDGADIRMYVTRATTTSR